jgi:DNA-binding response OmpR family regulator
MPEDKKKKILIVEDESALSRVLELKISKSGLDTSTARDGIEALALLKKERFDLVLTDLIMPRMNGFDLIAAMRQNGDQTPVIVLSNLSQEADRKRVKEFGAIDFIVKGQESITAVVERIKAALSHSGPVA